MTRRRPGEACGSCDSCQLRLRRLRGQRHQRSGAVRPRGAGGVAPDADRRPESAAEGQDLSRSSRSSGRRFRARERRLGCRRTSSGSAAATTAALGATRCTPSTLRSFAATRCGWAPRRSCAALDRLPGAPALGQSQRRQPGASPPRRARGRAACSRASWCRSRLRGRCGGIGSRQADRLTVSPKPPSSGHGDPAPRAGSSSDSWTGSSNSGASDRADSQGRVLRRAPISCGRSATASAIPADAVDAVGRHADPGQRACPRAASATGTVAVRTGRRRSGARDCARAAAASRHCLEGGTRRMSEITDARRAASRD